VNYSEDRTNKLDLNRESSFYYNLFKVLLTKK